MDSSPKSLWVFDFDYTIVDDNSDTFIYRAFPNKKLPSKVESFYKNGFWTDFMQKVFISMKKTGISPFLLKEILEEIPITPGFLELFSQIKARKSLVDFVVISDSNSLFIEWIMKKHEIFEICDKIYTNPAKIVDDLIEISPFHQHDCENKCSVNMCKKLILSTFLQEKQMKYERIFYVGDGGNDYCPLGILGEKDCAFVRKGYGLEKKIEENAKIGYKNKAEVFLWENGFEILRYLKEKNIEI